MLDPWWQKHIYVYKRTWRPTSVRWVTLNIVMGHQFKSLLCTRLGLAISHIFENPAPSKVCTFFYQHIKISVCLALGFPPFFPHDLCFKVQASLAHTCLKATWHSSRHSTYAQLLLTDIFMSLLKLGSEFFRYRKESLCKKAHAKGAKRQKLEEIECIDFQQQDKGNL